MSTRNTSNESTVPRLRLVGEMPPVEPAAAHPAQPPASSDRLIHELANLLDGSLRNVGLALRRVNQDGAPAEQGERLLDHLETASGALEHMSRLIQAYHQGRGLSVNAGFDADTPLGQVLEHAVRMIRPVAREQEIEIEVDIANSVADLPLGYLYPVLVNALRNAVEAMGQTSDQREVRAASSPVVDAQGRLPLRRPSAPEAEDLTRCGMVTVSAGLTGHGRVEIAIEDDGPGLASTLPRDEDGLVEPGVTTKASGSGLGLLISRDIVRSLGGQLTLEDRKSGGARVRIDLPQTHAHRQRSFTR